MDARITQLATIVAQIVATLNQANGMPVPSAMQELGIKIPQPNERREEPNLSRAVTQDHQIAGTRNLRGNQSRNQGSLGPRVGGHCLENTAPRKVVASSGHTSHHKSSNHRDLRDHLNNQLYN